MLHEVFYWLFNMSITASLVGLVVLLLRRIKKIPRRISVLLWLIPYLRMCVPFGLDSPYSLLALLSGFTTKTVVVYHPAGGISFSGTNHVMGANGYFPITYKADRVGEVFRVASVLWILVAGVILLAWGILYLTTMREMKDAVRFSDNLYYSHKVISPGVYGIIRPKIVLPLSYQDKDIRYVILHEKAHIKRGDNLWRVLAFFLTAIHWFNPLAWVFLRLFLNDLELACDERVLAGIGDSQVKAYARSLLDCGESTNLFVSAFGGAKIRTRIENILSFKKMTWFSLIGFLALLFAIFGILLTNAG